MEKELSPCAFCGSGAVSMVHEGPDSSGMHFAHFRCGHCGAEGPSGVGTSRVAAIRDARTEWNRRAERTCCIVTMDMAGKPPYRDGDWILNELSDGCSECGYPFDTPNRGTPNYCPNCGARVVGE